MRIVETMLDDGQYLDDDCWGEGKFGFRVCRFREVNGRPEVSMSDHYIFVYDEEDEEDYGWTAEEQVSRWIDRWFY